jgi:predicted protein tyrosine phosphatase
MDRDICRVLCETTTRTRTRTRTIIITIRNIVHQGDKQGYPSKGPTKGYIDMGIADKPKAWSQLRKSFIDKVMTRIYNARNLYGQDVYVFCNAGVSRSATVVILYLIYKHKLSCQEAYDFVKSKRRWIEPNEGFMAGLHAEDQYFKSPSSILH